MSTHNEPWSPTFDYLSVEGALIQRIKHLVAGLDDVVPEASLDGVEEANLAPLTVAVVWVGDRPKDDASGLEHTAVEQYWAASLVVNVANDDTGEHACTVAGPLIAQLIRAVRGWVPFEGYDAFAWTGNTEPTLRPGGTLYVPLIFKTGFVV